MWKFVAYIVLLACLAIAAAWYSQQRPVIDLETTPSSDDSDAWLEDLYSRNPHEAEGAERELNTMGAAAIPAIERALQTPGVSPDRRKAALKACAILGPAAASAVPSVAAQLDESDLTEEAALALSFMGRPAFEPLREALASDDADVRREALRSIGKLKARAPLATWAVLPLLVQGMRDTDNGVRSVAATYLGIINEEPETSVPTLMAGLADDDVEVRKASAIALGSFGDAARPALPALRQAARDRDRDLAHEAGRALIRLQAR